MRPSGEQSVAPAVFRGRDALVEELARLGVERIFGVMGDGNLGWLALWAACDRNDYVSARHESGAVAMADGVAWQTGRPAVSTVTYGPGLLNAMNALATAHRGGAGQVLITASPTAAREHHVQRYDQPALVAAIGAVHVGVDAPERIAPMLRAAYERAAATGALVVLDIDEDAFDAEVGDEIGSVLEPLDGGGPPAFADDLAALAAVDVELRAASEPILLAGVGAERAGAAEALERLADATGAWLATTLVARGLFAGHPRYLGTFGGFTTEDARPIVDRCDLVVAFGASLNEYTSDHGRLLEGRRVVQIDRAAGALGRQYAVDLGVQCDAAVAAAALLARYEAPEAPARTTDAERDLTSMVPSEDASDATGIDPRVAMHLLDGWLPDDRVVVSDGGHFIEWPSRYLRAPRPRSFRAAVAGGSIAMGLPQAIGIARAGLADAVVAVIGDGGFFMALTEVETAAREGIPVIVIVVDDRAYSAEVYKLRKLGLPEDLAYFDDAADVVAVSAALGTQAIRIVRPEDVADLPDPRSLAGPLVLDVQVTRAVASSRLAS